ncbi:putative toxin-antitoxin system toxin component, PIN family [bacterium]|nr:putative toxin-antitoxin system toxin component, PIN family [bacterium]OIO88707.1 MAG: putative toxin-antitoxin system toxin component, PIN family [Anaerolineae bacterium CG2_30_58_95]PJH75905.1 MAG: putative toxin-antitoxin system toxin component, PIN family [Anaerolineae bacterium CG_4_9_14_0_8_um_filter_58_9]
MLERVVFDTNVLISGLLWRGKPYQCLLLARAKIVQAVYCPPMLAELSEKLRKKFKFSESRIHAVVTDVRRYAERVEIPGTLAVILADPTDDKFIECALVGKAACVVSSDHHLLELGGYQKIQIVSPEIYTARFVP